jgi:hypothetical protein
MAGVRGLELGNVGFLESRPNSLVFRTIFVPETFCGPAATRPVLGVGVGIGPSKVRGYVHAIDEKPVEEVDHRHGLTIPTCRQQVSCGLSGFKAANGGRATNGA